MIYRNDQDATLARLDALEAEHARVIAENEELRGALHRASQKPAYVVGRDTQVVAAPAATIATSVETPTRERISGAELAFVSIAGLIAGVVVVLVAIAIAGP
jgi:hypothetical protein